MLQPFILNLPTELHLLIISYLTAPERQLLRAACKHFHIVIPPPSLLDLTEILASPYNYKHYRLCTICGVFVPNPAPRLHPIKYDDFPYQETALTKRHICGDLLWAPAHLNSEDHSLSNTSTECHDEWQFDWRMPEHLEWARGLEDGIWKKRYLDRSFNPPRIEKAVKSGILAFLDRVRAGVGGYVSDRFEMIHERFVIPPGFRKEVQERLQREEEEWETEVACSPPSQSRQL